MRLFLAIDLAARIRKDLRSEIESIARDYPDFNWIDPKNYHITLHFFGEVGDVEETKKRIEDLLFDIPDFHLYTRNAGIFIGQKITLYVSFEREKVVETIVKKMRNKFDVQNNQKFIPHLTIARTRIPSKQQYLHLKKKLSKHSSDVHFPVKHICLFDTVITGQKPVYKKIAVFNLSG